METKEYLCTRKNIFKDYGIIYTYFQNNYIEESIVYQQNSSDITEQWKKIYNLLFSKKQIKLEFPIPEGKFLAFYIKRTSNTNTNISFLGKIRYYTTKDLFMIDCIHEIFHYDHDKKSYYRNRDIEYATFFINGVRFYTSQENNELNPFPYFTEKTRTIVVEQADFNKVRMTELQFLKSKENDMQTCTFRDQTDIDEYYGKRDIIDISTLDVEFDDWLLEYLGNSSRSSRSSKSSEEVCSTKTKRKHI